MCFGIWHQRVVPFIIDPRFTQNEYCKVLAGTTMGENWVKYSIIVLEEKTTVLIGDIATGGPSRGLRSL